MAGKRRRSRRNRRNRLLVPGTPPGTLLPAEDSVPTQIGVMAFGPDDFTEARLKTPDEIRAYIGKWPVVWVNLDGLGDADTIARVGDIFGLHALALEDAVNVRQRPKTDDYDSHLFTVCRMMNRSESGDIDLEQVAFFMGGGFLVSMQERAGDCWDHIRDRVRRGTSRKLREGGADYLLYMLLDSMVDGYFPALEKLGDYIDDLEDRALSSPSRGVMSEIQDTKRPG